MKSKLLGFLSGLAVGAGLVIAAKKYSESECGQKTIEDMKKMMSDFYNFVSPKVKMVKNLSRAKYRQIINEAAEEYGKIKKLSDETIEELISRTLDMWSDFLENNEER